MEIIYRDAKIEDVSSIAGLVDLAAGGFIDLLYQDVIPGKRPVEIIEDKLASAEPPLTWKNAIVAEIRGQVAGLSLSYPSEQYRITPEMERLIPKDRLELVRENYTVRVENSWFLDYLAVLPKYHGNGIGGTLIEKTKKRAIAKGYDILSLSAFSDNSKALELYFRHGFEPFCIVGLSLHELSPHEGGCLLMKCSLRQHYRK